MELLLGEALVVGSFVVFAMLYARPGPMWLAVGAAAPWFFAGNVVIARLGLDTLVLTTVLHFVLVYVALGTATVLRSLRGVELGLLAGPRGVDVPFSELAGVVALARESGFELGPAGLVWNGDMQLAVLVDGEGTRAEIMQSEGRMPGFAFATELVGERPVVSVPWSHGIDDGKIRVKGATFAELLGHHRDAVRAAVAAGAVVRAVTPADGLELALGSDRDELGETLARPWRNAFLLMAQQSPLRVLLAR